MSKQKPHKTITISFMDNDEENKLYDEIIKDSKLIGKSKWGKLAFREKLERSKNNQSSGNNNSTPNNQSFHQPYQQSQNSNSPYIDSLEELMP